MKKCGDCLIRKQAGGKICPIFQEEVLNTDNACRRYIGHDSPVCGFCGSLMPGKPEIVIMEDGTTLLACGQCGDRIGTCATCAQARVCEFETSTSPIPKQVQKVIRQGNMQMAQMIRNPEREKETCMKGCPCWDSEECICVRQAGNCKSWRL